MNQNEINEVQRKFLDILIKLHNTNKTDNIPDFGLLLLIIGSIMGDINAVSLAMTNYPENANPATQATPRILTILRQFHYIESVRMENNRPDSPTSIRDVNIDT